MILEHKLKTLQNLKSTHQKVNACTFHEIIDRRENHNMNTKKDKYKLFSILMKKI